MNRALLLTQIEDAEQKLTGAEEVLADAIHALDAVARAEKTISGVLIDGAFDNLKASKAKLSELKVLLMADDRT